MLHKKTLLFFFLFVFSLRAFPAIFVVTSNADSGPGTLRDALRKVALADSSVTNYIYFNLPDVSQAGRTITLFSKLPDLSSNLVIDGSTQTGSKFGVSDACVALFFQTPVNQTISALSIVNKHDVAIYGLYLKFLTDVTKSNLLYFWTGIGLRNDKNVTIGAMGKGNVVSGFYNPLIVNSPVNEFEYFENLTLKDNIFGLDADGETLSVNQISAVPIGQIIGNVNIGGTIAEGNVFAQGLSINQENNVDSTNPADYYISSPAFIKIQNNKIGVDYLVQNGIATSSGINLSTTDPGGKNNCIIEDNVIAAPQWYAIDIGNNGLPLYILRNYIGTDKTLTKSFKTGGIFIYGATSAAIGSSNTADANYITNCNPVSILPFSNVTVNKNSFYCPNFSQPMHGGNNVFDFEFPFPVINILNISATSLSGTATPNSNIELFYSDKCGTCSPQTYFASTTADANGNWQYSGTINGTVIASATLGLNTSDFTQTSINTDKVTIVNACGNGFGSIKGVVPQNAQNVEWVDSQGNVVGTKPDLLNVKVGKYRLIAKNGTCKALSSFFEILDKFQLDITNVKIVDPSCGNSTGSVSGLNLTNNEYGSPTFVWTDASGKTVGNALVLSAVPSGTYNLAITSADKTCIQNYGPFTLVNTTGPNIDQSNVAIQSTNCGQSTGSITNLAVTGTGTLKYIWWNSQQQTVGTAKDLLGQPAGIYKLEVSDDSQCGSVYTTDITIPETNGITMDDSKVVSTVTTCSKDNGSVTGITVTGATAYQWVNGNNQPVGQSIDLQNQPSGDYTLTASNGFGCSKTSKVYHIGQDPPTQYPVYTTSIVPACFGKNNGSVSVATDVLVSSARWINSQGQPIGGNNTTITDLPGGTYQLYVTDKNGCENLYKSYTVTTITQLQILAGAENVIDDQCTLHTGSITNIQVSGGVQPYAWSWVDAGNQIVSSSPDLMGVGAGVYTLSVNDASGCGLVSASYTVQNQSENISPPSVSNLQLCSAGDALLQVSSPSSGYSYRLYADQTATTPLDEQTSGNFKITVKSNTILYVSQVSGTCESQRTAVQVSVGISAVDIANAFTPNGDGINDYWVINGIASYPLATIQVFTRYGQKIFESKGYATPFDGTFEGKKLSPGVYYYIINLKSNCNLLSGSLTIIR